MNLELLNDYGINFTKNSNATYKISAASINLGIYLELIQRKGLIQLILDDIELALTGDYSDIDDPDWDVELGRFVYSGSILPDMTFEVFYEESDSDSGEYFPLADIKEILLSWQEYTNN